MSTISTDYNSKIHADYRVENSTPLTEAEIKAKVIEVQTENLQAIEKGLEQDPTGRGGKVKIKVPADANGNPISKPTAQDWDNAAKTGKFAEVEGSPGSLASEYYGLHLVNFDGGFDNKLANKALLQELRDALGKGISFPTTEAIPRSEVGDVVRALQARQRALGQVERGMGNPNAGVWDPPRERVEIKVPAGPDGKPIENPKTQDWIDAQKNNRWATVSGKPADLALEKFGVKIDMANWRESYKSNKAAFTEAFDYGIQKFGSNMRIANGEFSPDALLDVPDAGKIIKEVFAVLGPAYSDDIEKAKDLKVQMDSLKKKNDALQKLENSVSTNNTAGSNSVDDFEVPTKRYVYDEKGNKKRDSDGNPITEAVTPPPSDLDWAHAAEWKSVKELNGGKSLNGREVAEKYFGFKLSNTSGDNAHNINLSNNLQKIGNARTSVQSEMSKLSGQFDFHMGNAQTNLQYANKIIANINDMMMSIARGI